MEFTTERLLLREYKIDDFESVHRYASDPDFSKYDFWGPNTPEDTKKFLSEMIAQSLSNPRFKFEVAVCLKDGGRQIGGCGIRRESELSSIGNIGWAMCPEYQARGYTTEAARALIDFGFNTLNLAVIYATCDTRNIASYKVMEKLGMKRVGLIKGQKVKGYLRDSYRYEILL